MILSPFAHRLYHLRPRSRLGHSLLFDTSVLSASMSLPTSTPRVPHISKAPTGSNVVRNRQSRSALAGISTLKFLDNLSATSNSIFGFTISFLELEVEALQNSTSSLLATTTHRDHSSRRQKVFMLPELGAYQSQTRTFADADIVTLSPCTFVNFIYLL